MQVLVFDFDFRAMYQNFMNMYSFNSFRDETTHWGLLEGLRCHLHCWRHPHHRSLALRWGHSRPQGWQGGHRSLRPHRPLPLVAHPWPPLWRLEGLVSRTHSVGCVSVSPVPSTGFVCCGTWWWHGRRWRMQDKV